MSSQFVCIIVFHEIPSILQFTTHHSQSNTYRSLNNLPREATILPIFHQNRTISKITTIGRPQPPSPIPTPISPTTTSHPHHLPPHNIKEAVNHSLNSSSRMSTQFQPREPSDQEKLIADLREQVHKSFLQINEMERLFAMEIEHARQELQDREKALCEQQEQLVTQRQDLAARMKQHHYIESISDIDEHSLQDIPYMQHSQRDSGIYTKLQEMIGDCQLKSCDPTTVLTGLSQLHSTIQKSLGRPLPQLQKLFSLANDYCLDTFRLRQQLRNSSETAEVYKKKLQQTNEALLAVRANYAEVRDENGRLCAENSRLESSVRTKEAELQWKKKELQTAWEQNSKLLDGMRSNTSESSQDQTCKSVLGEQKLNEQRNVNKSYTQKPGKTRPNYSSFEKGRLSLQPQNSCQMDMFKKRSCRPSIDKH